MNVPVFFERLGEKRVSDILANAFEHVNLHEPEVVLNKALTKGAIKEYRHLIREADKKNQ